MTDLLDRIAGKTIAGAFLDTVAERGDDVAIRWKEGDDWKEWTYAEMADLVAHVAGGLRANGVEDVAAKAASLG